MLLCTPSTKVGSVMLPSQFPVRVWQRVQPCPYRDLSMHPACPFQTALSASALLQATSNTLAGAGRALKGGQTEENSAAPGASS